MQVTKGIKRKNLTIKVNYISLWKWTVRFLKSIKLNALFFSIPHLIIHVRIHRSLQSFRIKLIAIITGEGSVYLYWNRAEREW